MSVFWANFSTRKLICSPRSEWEHRREPACPLLAFRADRIRGEWGKLEAPSQSKPLKSPCVDWENWHLSFDGALAFLFPCYQCSGWDTVMYYLCRWLMRFKILQGLAAIPSLGSQNNSTQIIFAKHSLRQLFPARTHTSYVSEGAT